MVVRKRLRAFSVLVATAIMGLVVLGYGLSGMAGDRLTARATANIQGPGITGKLDLREGVSGTLYLDLRVKGDPAVLTTGLHGVHFHETGTCDASAKFASAKGHFDPGPFGNTTPVQDNHPFHLGDLPNLQVNAKGEGLLRAVTTRASLKAGAANSLLDTDGAALIVHRNTDVQKVKGTADEAGGARLACGVIK